jgi:tetratricopeptide (TPR) repeat protein
MGGGLKGRVRLRLVFFAALALFPRGLYGQDARGGVLFAAEMGGIEKKLGDPALSPTERRGNLIRRARLLTLAGNIEGAAQSWTEAAFAEPGTRDDESLLAGARCLMALGEFDQAEAHVRTILLTGVDKLSLAGARFLNAQIEAFKSGGAAALEALTANPDYADIKPALWYTLWRISGAEAYKQRLLEEYPASPEAGILRGALGSPALALWLLFPGREDAPRAAGANRAEAAAGTEAAGATEAEPAGVLQTGLFSAEENARAMAERLRNAGFSPALHLRRVNDREYWAVSVPPGPDTQQTIMRLKDAGFESFPVF